MKQTNTNTNKWYEGNAVWCS